MANTQLTGALNGANAINGLTQGFLNTTVSNVSQKGTDVSFADTLSQTGSTPAKADSVKEPAMTKTVVDKASSANVKNDLSDTKDVQSLDDSQVKDLSGETADKASKIIEKLEDTLDASEDDVKAAMEVLALSMTDLFDASNLQSLVMELTGTEDSVSLITDVALYGQLKDITDFADEMLGELSDMTGIDSSELLDFITTDDKFGQLISEAMNNGIGSAKLTGDEETAVNVSDVKPDTESIDKNVSRADEDNVTDEQLKVLTQDLPKTETVSTITYDEADDAAEAVNAAGSEANTNGTEAKAETVKIEINGQKADDGKNNDRLSQNENTAFAQAPQPQTVNPAAESIVNTLESYTSEQAQEIFRQITDFVKVNITQESQSMEMQLHPASLGTVNMQINSANGQITAHLTVQNELVKAVLESQLIQLQQTFNEQGTKVEAIEVTVANYNLDSAMSNNTDNSESESSRGGGTSRRRNINLSLDSPFDDMTDEEMLAREIMDMNGNSVDYLA